MTDLDGGASMSGNRVYRYRLWRTWDWAVEPANFVMLNPSTADESEDDPTVRRCIGFARLWGYGGLVVTNLYALRSADPSVILSHPDPVGAANDTYLSASARRAGVVVVAWGNNAEDSRGAHVLGLLRRFVDVSCLGTTKAGHPRHPLYMRADTELVTLHRTK